MTAEKFLKKGLKRDQSANDGRRRAKNIVHCPKKPDFVSKNNYPSMLKKKNLAERGVVD